MTKQEFLAMSLPHKLNVYVKYNHKPDNSELETMIGIVDDCIVTDMHEEEMAPLSISNYGLCLRPLSDITKPIEHKGKKFVPINKLKTYFGWGYLWDCYKKRETINVYAIPYACLSKLIEWHFNLMDEREEFVDVNTLPKNPYE